MSEFRASMFAMLGPVLVANSFMVLSNNLEETCRHRG